MVGLFDATKTNRIQRLPYLKGTHTVGFLPAKLQLFREPAREMSVIPLLTQTPTIIPYYPH